MQETNGHCRHIAIIMDGNGRWAKKNRFKRAIGHREGVKAVKRIVKAAQEESIEVLTIYAFSTENWKRPQAEVSFLMELLYKTIESELESLHRASVNIRFIGDLARLPSWLQAKLNEAAEKTAQNGGLILNIAVNYGGRAEIVALAQAIAKSAAAGELQAEEIDEQYLSRRLALGDLPPIDLLIRTSGEQRISNFLLWQLAYTEFYFTECHWPDFTHEDLKCALADYAARDRRFGAIKEE